MVTRPFIVRCGRPRNCRVGRGGGARGTRGVPAGGGAPHVARHPLALVEALDGRGREPDVQVTFPRLLHHG